jgi:hypothetical protein
MIPRNFESIKRGDLETLVAHQVAERRTLEFKRDLPGGSERDRKEFLADVSSFANAQGGDILFGIDAPQGVAVGLAGLAVDDGEKEVLRWEDVLLAGVEPRMPGVRLRWIDCGDGRGVMLIRVPASSIAPHRVIFARTNRFYGRKSNGKYEMDTHELRDAFTASEALPARLRALHVEAVDRAVRGELPIGLGDDPKAILSLIPVTLFREARDLEITPENALAAHKSAGHLERIRMIDGVLLHTNPSESGAVRSYAITYRQGRVEMVWTIGKIVNETRKDETPLIWPKRFEDGVLDAAISGAAKLAPFGVEGPWVVMVTVTGIKDYLLVLNQHYTSPPAWLSEATLPPLMIEQMSRAALLPIMRSFWLAFGEERPADPFNE